VTATRNLSENFSVICIYDSYVLLQANLLFSDGPSVDQIALEKEKEPQPSTSGGQSSRSALEIDAPIRDDGFGGNLGQDIIGAVRKLSNWFAFHSLCFPNR
jgi:hypothetical protein